MKIVLKNNLTLQIVWLFFFLNNIGFVFQSGITTTRVVMFASLFSCILLGRLKSVDAKSLYLIFLVLVLSAFNFLVSLYGDVDSTQFSRLVHFALYSIVGAIVYVSLFNDEALFHKAVIGATLIQVFFVFVTYSSPAANNIIFSYVYVSHNFLESLGRAPGLSSSGGATLSVIISLGAFSIVRLSMLEKHGWFIPTMLIIIFSQVLVGRTGLLLSIFALCMLLIYSDLNIRTIILTILGLILSQLILLDYIKSNEQFMAYTKNWAESSLTGSDGTISALIDMGIKEMDTMAFIIGTGQVATPDGYNASGSDVGYVQTFYAMGLLGVVFYMALLLFLYSFYKKTNKSFYFLVLLFLPFVAEIKEPFIFKYMIVFYVFISLIHGREKLNEASNNSQ
ncbi:hypothetical protein J8M20_11870 [Pseudoalteromonas luteoviolacea]|uniref:hypothetical protein n=1 Tax=Pseudoalteromonas luteoviolacea TaxID=43657 RepID=UPI001B36D95E|nr:hypothetical protein [Pseudoalteromonas luteoviolacea]MBQ4812043.1 hypothetical protein [Pseudoalteromonas luteoviolacea]